MKNLKRQDSAVILQFLSNPAKTPQRDHTKAFLNFLKNKL